MSSTPINPRLGTPWWQVLALAPHRAMFAAGALQGSVALTGWLYDLLGDITGWYPTPDLQITEGWAHGYLMIYGFFPFFMFGFLMTALPNWVNEPKLPAGTFMPSAALMFAGVSLFYPGMLWFEPLIYFGVALQFGGWLVGLFGLARRLPFGTGQDLRHPLAAVTGMAVGAVGLLVFDFAVVSHHPGAARLSLWAGIWMFLLPVFLTVAHRMIPYFSSRVLTDYRVVRPFWALWVLIAAAVTHGVLMILGLPPWSWIPDLVGAAVSLNLVIAWRINRSFENRLLAVLHLAFVWVPVAFALSAVETLGAFHGTTVFRVLAPMHALGVGFFSCMLIAMASRVTLGHSGLPLVADRSTWFLFLGMLAAATLRVGASMPFTGAYAGVLLLVSGVLWVLSFGFWTIKYLPLYFLPRADGKPG